MNRLHGMMRSTSNLSKTRSLVMRCFGVYSPDAGNPPPRPTEPDGATYNLNNTQKVKHVKSSQLQSVQLDNLSGCSNCLQMDVGEPLVVRFEFSHELGKLMLRKTKRMFCKASIKVAPKRSRVMQAAFLRQIL
jgi:hypothetical protein